MAFPPITAHLQQSGAGPGTLDAAARRRTEPTSERAA